ncbi:cysteine hydrolase [Streptomonospora nanhaiensis]|uniref:Nicotinamidase-related amidase n=1 Tax=Streptomonospora nanhaiensis TaxID=1323731 RepID=A0A853BI86_9ACTN|nr:cysteine hydrolase [Streptomonospora nanhaiensis]MBV2365268.1 cysteine hydrolase [Streptomonospora nanhaiensis]MBX9390311.1 cysteine hydrolase [Streptomonospora nanhaiensis]NYI94730.1 nicotinamidase-related amidase [Streptomonospora nanhaiensis]
MTIATERAAVLALHWQVNVIRPEGFFGGMLSEPVRHSGVVGRAVGFHARARAAGLPIVFTRFVIPEGEGALVRNTAFMAAVGDAQESFRPDAPGSLLIPEMAALEERDVVADGQRLSGLAATDLPDRLAAMGVDTLLVTGVATNLTVEQTARNGTDLGFTVHVIADCTAAADPDVHAASLANLDLTTAGCLTAEEALARVTG